MRVKKRGVTLAIGQSSNGQAHPGQSCAPAKPGMTYTGWLTPSSNGSNLTRVALIRERLSLFEEIVGIENSPLVDELVQAIRTCSSSSV